MLTGGGPLAAIVAPANAHDSTLIEAATVDRPPVEEHLCLAKAFGTPAAGAAVAGTAYQSHIRRIGDATKPCDPATGHKSRRWVVSGPSGG